jgi:hypothetical protein
VVGVDQDRPVGLDHQQAHGHRQDRGQPTGVDDLAAGDEQTHRDERYAERRREGMLAAAQSDVSVAAVAHYTTIQPAETDSTIFC